MTSSRPYLLRAIHEWITDNGLTPQFIVDANVQGVQVPMQFIRDGKIVLNLSATAVRNLVMSNEAVMFGSRFAGRHHDIIVPVAAVMAVYAAESGVGMAFQNGGAVEEAPSDPDDEPPPRPTLRVVK